MKCLDVNQVLPTSNKKYMENSEEDKHVDIGA